MDDRYGAKSSSRPLIMMLYTRSGAVPLTKSPPPLLSLEGRSVERPLDHLLDSLRL